MYRSRPSVSRRSYITPLRRSILRVGDLGGLGELLDSLYRSNLANETETIVMDHHHFIREREESRAPGVNRQTDYAYVSCDPALRTPRPCGSEWWI